MGRVGEGSMCSCSCLLGGCHHSCVYVLAWGRSASLQNAFNCVLTVQYKEAYSAAEKSSFYAMSCLVLMHSGFCNTGLVSWEVVAMCSTF